MNNILRRSPFKVNKVESDPQAFGLRIIETRSCVEALYNDRSILITGPRGIGKSSLGVQMQNILMGNPILLRRCGIETDLPFCLCAFKVCSNEETLDQIIYDILSDFENQVSRFFYTSKINTRLEFNLGIFKTQIETELQKKKFLPATLANILVNALFSIINKVDCDMGLNIMIDEVDQISKDINFGHFIKVVHETLNRKGIENVTFIFAGQSGVFSRFNNEDPSFERIVTHIPISTLDSKASEHILDYAQENCRPPFLIESPATKMILSLASGYPYVIHLISDYAFTVMKDVRKMKIKDVLNGLQKILQSDKKEKYLNHLKSLTKDERKILVTLSAFQSENVPVNVPLGWINDRFGETTENSLSVEKIISNLNNLVEKQYLRISRDKINKKTVYYSFSEELFRVFISLKRIELYELIARNRSKKLSDQHIVVSTFNEPFATDKYFFDNDDIVDSDIKGKAVATVIEQMNHSEFDYEYENEDTVYLDSIE